MIEPPLTSPRFCLELLRLTFCSSFFSGLVVVALPSPRVGLLCTLMAASGRGAVRSTFSLRIGAQAAREGARLSSSCARGSMPPRSRGG